ncbi:MAG: DUF1638 domain-containing protein [Acidobacteria bacterium]|nr:DUF1638 domain-containing protein [Acidobacteriota bacterium]
MRNASMEERPVALVGCRVLQSAVEACGLGDVRATFLEYGLHRTPSLLRGALQRHLDGLAEPSVVLMAYGLCGNGVQGLQAGRHTLVFPRCHDCIAMLLGSHDAYMREFTTAPGTYFLSKGWLECGSHPLREYEEYVTTRGEKMARWLIDQLYHNYTRVAFVGAERQDFVDYGPRARQVAEFLGASYVELEGSDRLIRRLLDTPRTLEERDPEVVVVRAGDEVAQAAFLR